MPSYLLEIGTEELPADYVGEAQERLKTLFIDALNQANLPFESLQSFGTPRRLSCLVSGLADLQNTVKKKVKGPPVKSSFDASGKALPPAIGFAQKQGLSLEQLGREEIGGVEYLHADLTIEGKAAAEVLKEIVPGIITHLSGERLMRWGDSDLRFSRPIRWLLSILEADQLEIQIDGIKSGRHTFGNRVLAPEKLEIKNTASYVDSLRNAKVLVDPKERKQLIEKQVSESAAKLSGTPRQLKGSLLEEVTNILEWPHALVGEFSRDYLELPDTLIETIMVHHQRYFPVESKERKEGSGANKLLPYFIAVSNNDREEAQPHMKLGNERVIKARLADGRFFYFEDQKCKMEERNSALDQLSFQGELGSYLKKAERLCLAAKRLSSDLMLDAKLSICLERTLALCKLDLVSNLVRELPELQGYVGSWYAQQEGESPEVVEAIASHYAPRYQDDSIPQDKVGQFASAIDKLDNLVGLFALGRRPSGSSDPYAIRRQSQGLADILMSGLNDYPINVSELMALLIDQLKPSLQRKKGFDAVKALTDLSEFLVQRVRSNLLEQGLSREVIEAICASGKVLVDIPDAVTRAKCLENLIASDSQLRLVRAGVRISKILSDDSTNTALDPGIFTEEAEKELFAVFKEKVQQKWPESKLGHKLQEADYKDLLQVLSALPASVEKFFDNVMVEDPDKTKRGNRHALLASINRYFSLLGDFRCLKPLLP